MKFEIEITDRNFRRLKEELINQDMDSDLSDEKYIAELFWIEDRYGSDFDIRQKIKIKKI